METETQILIAEMLKYITPDSREIVIERSAEVGRLVNGLSNSLVKRLQSEH